MMKTTLNFLSIFLLLACTSCFDNNAQSEALKFKADTLHFEITEANNIVFKSILNEVDTLDLFLDTGGTEIVLKHTAVKGKTSLLEGKNEHYKEENYEPLGDFNTLSLGAMTRDSLTIYPTDLLPKEADGHFGWNLFEHKVVELDYDKNIMIVHDSFFGKTEGYAKLEIEYINTLFCIQGDLKVGDSTFTNRYLFDSGFQRAIVMDRELRVEDKFPTNLPVLKESRLRNSEGTDFINQVVRIDEICFGDICAAQIPVQLLSTPNPARFKTHILGNELLKRFNTILDFQNGFVYLKPNSLMDLPYTDAP